MEKRYVKHIGDKVLVKMRNEIVVLKNGMQYINPREEILLADGWEELAEPAPVEEDAARQEAENAAESARGFLADTDYKIIKCMEAYLCGESLPYDIRELHRTREAHRRLINENENYGETSSNL